MNDPYRWHDVGEMVTKAERPPMGADWPRVPPIPVTLSPRMRRAIEAASQQAAEFGQIWADEMTLGYAREAREDKGRRGNPGAVTYVPGPPRPWWLRWLP